MFGGDFLDHGLNRESVATNSVVTTEVERLAGDTALIWVGIGFVAMMFVVLPFFFGK